MKRACVKAFALTAVLCGLSAACAADKSEISVAIMAEPETFDIAKTTATVAYQMTMGNVFEKLLTFDSRLQTRLELAESAEHNDDYTEFTYKLRRSVKFHNGEEMKADDVVASVNRWLAGGLMRRAVGKARFEKVDDYTIRIRMEQPMMTFNQLLSTMRPAAIIVPKSVIDRADPKTGVIREYIGTGPYKFAKLEHSSYLQLEKFDGYVPYGEKGQLDGWRGYKEAKTPSVRFNLVPDPATRVAGVQFGEYDIGVQMPYDDFEQFYGSREYRIYSEPQGDIAMIYNKKQGIASNKLFRQAVNAALNCGDIMKAAYSRLAFYKLSPAFVQDSRNPWYNEKGKESYNQANPEKARELLKQSGYKGEPFRFVVSSHYQEFYNAALVINEELKAIGVNVSLDVVDWATYLAKAKNPSAYDVFLTGFANWGTPGVIVWLSGAWNGWSADEHLADLMGKVSHSTDPAEAARYFEEVQAYCWNDYVPVSKLGDRFSYSVASSRVKGLTFLEALHMWNVTVEEQ